MAKKKDIQSYKSEFSNWLKELENYQEHFQDNYDQYTGKNNVKGTETKISDRIVTGKQIGRAHV